MSTWLCPRRQYYLERKKQFKIPLTKDETDVEFLDRSFRKAFSYGNNVNVDISFQVYDDGWEEFVEIDREEEIKDRAKVTAVVMPSLITPSGSEVRYSKISSPLS